MKLLLIKDVAERLGVGRHAVRGFIDSDLLPVVKLPGREREYFTEEGLALFVERCTSGGPTPGPLDDPKPAKTEPQAALRSLSKGARTPVKSGKHAWRRQFRGR